MAEPTWHIKNMGHINATGNWVRPRRHHYAFVWPKDKPNLNKFGRFKDIMTGKGPDIFVTSNPNRKPHATDGPSRRRWTGFPNYETNGNTLVGDSNAWRGDAPWLQPYGPGSGVRDRKPYYDFRTRKFRSRPHNGQWTNAWYGPDGSTAAVEMWPTMNTMFPVSHPFGALEYFDPRNWGQNGDLDGEDGAGGYYNPIIDGWP